MEIQLGLGPFIIFSTFYMVTLLAFCVNIGERELGEFDAVHNVDDGR